jgi:hypothetical protein
MTPNEIVEHLKQTRGFLEKAIKVEGVNNTSTLYCLIHLLIAVEALAAHVAAQQSDGK